MEPLSPAPPLYDPGLFEPGARTGQLSVDMLVAADIYYANWLVAAATVASLPMKYG